jgi:hypothetical protein
MFVMSVMSVMSAISVMLAVSAVPNVLDSLVAANDEIVSGISTVFTALVSNGKIVFAILLPFLVLEINKALK